MKPMDFDDPDWAYMMECPICWQLKIGHSNNLSLREYGNRLTHKRLHGCEPRRLLAVVCWPGGGPAVETQWHHQFRHLRIKRTEWFRQPSPTERAALNALQESVIERMKERIFAGHRGWMEMEILR